MTVPLPEFADVTGVAGAMVYLGSYASLQAGFLRGEGYLYPALNATAATLVLISLGAYFNPFSAVIEISWITISLFGIARLWVLSRGLDFNPEERAFLEAALPGLSRLGCRRFLQAGRWTDAPQGTVLTVEGQPVEALTWIASGSAVVTHGGADVATLSRAMFVGELGVLGGVPATATVTLAEPSRLFSVPSDVLRALMKKNPEMKFALDGAIGADARNKFIAGNASLAALRSGRAQSSQAPGH